jgi:3-oxoacyl-[acyl-carrier-protein] synthase III
MKIGFEAVVGDMGDEVVNTKKTFAYLKPVIAKLPRETQLLYTNAPDEVRKYTKKSPVDVATGIAEKALNQAGLKPADIDFLIGAQGMTAVVHNKLGFKKDTPILNIMDACATFLDSAHFAESLVRGGECQRVLIMGAFGGAGTGPASQGDPTNPMVVNFGAGAAAAVVSTRNLKFEIVSYYTETYGEAYESARSAIGCVFDTEFGKTIGVEPDRVVSRMSMDDASWVEVAGRDNYLAGSVEKAMQKAGLKITDLYRVICHHIGDVEDKWIQSLVDKGLPASAFKSLRKTQGNVGYCDLIIDLVTFWESGELPQGSLIALWVPSSGIQLPTLVLRKLV